MKLFQVCGVCQKRKHWFGLTWKTYESFKDSQLLGKNAVGERIRKLTEIQELLYERSTQSKGILAANDLPTEIIWLESLRAYPVSDGDYIGNGIRIYLKG